jgi:hypothetical protein
MGQFSALLAFAVGGTLSGTTASPAFEPGQRTSDYGIWSRSFGDTYRAVSEAFILFDSAQAGNPFNPPSGSVVPRLRRGKQRITQTIDVNMDEFTSVASVQFFDANGKLLTTGCASAIGRRFK